MIEKNGIHIFKIAGKKYENNCYLYKTTSFRYCNLPMHVAKMARHNNFMVVYRSFNGIVTNHPMLWIFYSILKAKPYNLFDFEIKILHIVTWQNCE